VFVLTPELPWPNQPITPKLVHSPRVLGVNFGLASDHHIEEKNYRHEKTLVWSNASSKK
jgi:hypothetical protein